MNQQSIKSLIILFFTIAGSIFLAIDIFSGGGNQLGTTIRWAIVFGCIIGLGFPRPGVLIYLASLYYLDFLKRLLVLGDNMAQTDVMFSLAAGPVLIAAVCMNSTLNIAVNRISFRGSDYLFYAFCVLVSVIGVFQSQHRDTVSLAQSFVGSALIGLTALACYCQFRNREDIQILLKVLVITGIPMALYTFWQYFLGIADWEVRYILTGMSPVLANHYRVSQELGEAMRPFSTLNLHPSVGTVSAMMVIISFAILRNGKVFFCIPKVRRFGYLLISLIYLASMLMAQNRTSYFIPVFFAIFYFCFRNRILTVLGYSAASLTGILTVIFSQYLSDNINRWSSTFMQTAIGKRFGTLGTFQGRLNGFVEMTHKENWTAFGLDENLVPHSHDPLSAVLFRFGFIPLGGALLVSLIVLIWWHGKVLSVADSSQKKFLIILTALLFSTVLCGLVYGNLLFVSPVNAFLGAVIGISMAVLRRESELRQLPDLATSAMQSSQADESARRKANGPHVPVQVRHLS